MNNNTELAYMAGILDGEGYLGIGKVGYRGAEQRYRAWIQVANTNTALTNWVHEKFGGAIYIQHRPPPEKDRYTNNFPLGVGVELLRQLLPYLIIKKPQAEMLIAYSELGAKHGIGDIRTMFYDKMKQLNAKGKL